MGRGRREGIVAEEEEDLRKIIKYICCRLVCLATYQSNIPMSS